MNCDYICQTAIFNVVIFGVSAVLFGAYIFKRNESGRRAVAVFSACVCLAVSVIYGANLLGFIPTPMPPIIGRNLVASLGVLALLFSFAIWKW